MSSRAPGLALVALIVSCAFLAARAIDQAVSPLVLALVAGIALSSSGRVPTEVSPGARFASRWLLRFGVALLGFRVTFPELAGVGLVPLVAVIAISCLTFAGAVVAGRRLGLSPGLSLIVASGFSICGASAVAATKEPAGATDDEAAYAVALVTLCGTLMVVILPALGALINLSDRAFGAWAGASVHDVAQVVATASTHGSKAVETAVVVKLVRVALLAPAVVAVGLLARRERGGSAAAATPWFLLAFAGGVAIASSGVLAGEPRRLIAHVTEVLLVAALAGLGLSTRLGALWRVGGRPLIVGVGATVVIAALALLVVESVGSF